MRSKSSCRRSLIRAMVVAAMLTAPTQFVSAQLNGLVQVVDCLVEIGIGINLNLRIASFKIIFPNRANMFFLAKTYLFICLQFFCMIFL